MTREEELDEARSWLIHFNAASRAHGLAPIPLTEDEIAWTALLLATAPDAKADESALMADQE